MDNMSSGEMVLAMHGSRPEARSPRLGKFRKCSAGTLDRDVWAVRGWRKMTSSMPSTFVSGGIKETQPD